MAEKGAHLTATSLSKPSIFELVAQDSLSATFHPAARRIVQFLSTRNPEKYGWLVQWFDEVYLVLNTALQFHYLKYNGGSFAETFYGLHRVRLDKGAIPGQLSIRDRYLSILFLALVPYFRVKLRELSFQHQLNEADGILSENEWQRKGLKLLILTYKTANFIWDTYSLTQYLQYMSGRAETHSPSLALLGMTLCYAPENINDCTWTQMWKAVAKGKFRLGVPSLALVGSALTRSLELGAFFIQFLQWWNTEQTQTDITALPVPDPPQDEEQYRKYAGLCPICMQPWKTETLLSVSGLVFCYRCIRSHLRNTSSCPVTFYPATVEDLVRIYPSQS